ncbi:hypothetical protein DPEC_G00211770 [Dallia pectoralis]|uniref:Uncharacterized protein n=1 Tax=Dallia pectoralis TaxID=75939 RepID=A0ACC2G619_DALPE|nr:hypothetical protein DPEC_G00211770 [Dallia pectoralis]
MRGQTRLFLVVFSAALLPPCRVSNPTRDDVQSASDGGEKDESEIDVGFSPSSDQHHNNDVNYFSEKDRMSTAKPHGDLMNPQDHRNRRSSNTSRDIPSTTVMSVRPGQVHDSTGWAMAAGVAPICAYRVMEGGIGGRLCFRYTHLGFKCSPGDCQSVLSPGGFLLANILTNGSVLLQWTQIGLRGEAQGKTADNTAGPHLHKQEIVTKATNVRRQKGSSGTGVVEESRYVNAPPKKVFHGRHVPRGGFGLSCWWNGSYTQFECAGVHLGSGCRDFLLTELHENVPYRICLHLLASNLTSPHPSANQRDDPGHCVEFTVAPQGMQDIVIAMTTVGGAICVMLVIICLLVAYITENIMSPTTQHSMYRTRTRSCH